MKIVQEMYARGLEFMPIDIYRAKAKMFQIIDGKLMRLLPASKEWEIRRRRLWKKLQKTVHISHWMISVRGQK